MLETLQVNMSMNDRVIRINQPCSMRICFDEDGTACVRIIKDNGDVIEVPVFKSIAFEKELIAT